MNATISDAERHLRVLCAAAGFRSLRAMCAAANVDRTTLRRAIRGKRPGPAIMARLASALHCSVSTLEIAFRGTL